MKKTDKILLTVTIVSVISFLIFFMYHNCNIFPEKNRATYTIDIQHTSGIHNVKSFELPVGTNFYIRFEKSKYHSNTLLIYSKHKPFSNEFGTLAFNVEDYKILKIDIKK